MAGNKQKSSKAGRNKVGCESYKRRGQREKNKFRKIVAHLKRHPEDEAVRKVLTELSIVTGLKVPA